MSAASRGCGARRIGALSALGLVVPAGLLLLARSRPDDDEDEQGERQQRFQREDEHRVLVEQIGHGGFHQQRTLYGF
ncbi:hypothetical protein GSH05_26905 [Burkholderia pseudomallei]|uniref:Uncharacterized protein n=1 Tax=Burkholderia mallei TaxID=13373 RepID=A0AAX1XF39_BURML|nr:hypothetical protein CXQ84_03090 [Burkholderia pseudomallei]RKN93354.1 hypothetical protein D8O03_27410 [Burkholderia mallei]AYE29881.1 hypothetical protein CNX72_16785 [Burkholderia pseudomallei]AYX30712.1 hypothetical protein EGY16_16800 [Burkholderia pseudomallei]AYX37330.1 hypothetical protein EGY15_03355 [Burkholderia pseudomallei]